MKEFMLSPHTPEDEGGGGSNPDPKDSWLDDWADGEVLPPVRLKKDTRPSPEPLAEGVRFTVVSHESRPKDSRISGGVQKENNEDRLVLVQNRLIGVCDGISAMNGADIASEATAKGFQKAFSQIKDSDFPNPDLRKQENQGEWKDFIKYIEDGVFRDIRDAIQGKKASSATSWLDDYDDYNTGTTFAGVAFFSNHGKRFGLVLWAGDSRVYRSKNVGGSVERLTGDEDANPKGVSSSFGVENGASILKNGLHWKLIEVAPGDKFAAATDGVFNNVRDAQLFESNPVGAAKQNARLNREGDDDMTCVCIEIGK